VLQMLLLWMQTFNLRGAKTSALSMTANTAFAIGNISRSWKFYSAAVMSIVNRAATATPAADESTTRAI
jgi:hypothetical protein